ncbi:hypothetical protein [uncultured Enterococcus sp.]|jgi:hypothetical protein|uniref:hypothetical protein n=1 Tax=uncultured Enterococcus sp. TaxID=167972 RepID=UPI00205DBA89|nr:hypothetical protein [uncultured Enterococcus sp.]DAL95837.1 MAG TPA: hypothetical protein [Caudoviricetes sp.]
MKKIYKVLYPIGFEVHEVADDFPTIIPFVEVKPLEGLKNEQSQFYNFAERKWEEAVTQDYSKRLKLLETLAETVQKENEELKKAAEEQAIQTTDKQLAIAEVYEMLVPASKEAK